MSDAAPQNVPGSAASPPEAPSSAAAARPVDPQSIEGLFLAALELETPAERAAFLQQNAGSDPVRRRRLEALLRAYDDAGSFLEHSPVPQESYDFFLPTEKPGLLGVLGQYEVIDLIGRGGMGLVFRALDPRLNRIVAIKVMAPELAANPLARRRFLREAQAAAAVSHPHVVTIHGVDEQKLPYLVMECVVGQSLQQKLDKVGPLRLAEILRIGHQIADGLAAAHRQGLTHRDIKPANILLENGVERVKITDFGLARAADDVAITRTGEVSGTPQYMSPEQAKGERVDARSDLFSLGCVLYAMCTGRSPFRADSLVAAIRRVCEDTPRPIEELNPEIPLWLIEIINLLLAKDPAERFQTADEVSTALGRCLERLQRSSGTSYPAWPAPRPAPVTTFVTPPESPIEPIFSEAASPPQVVAASLWACRGFMATSLLLGVAAGSGLPRIRDDLEIPVDLIGGAVIAGLAFLVGSLVVSFRESIKGQLPRILQVELWGACCLSAFTGYIATRWSVMPYQQDAFFPFLLALLIVLAFLLALVMRDWRKILSADEATTNRMPIPYWGRSLVISGVVVWGGLLLLLLLLGTDRSLWTGGWFLGFAQNSTMFPWDADLYVLRGIVIGGSLCGLLQILGGLALQKRILANITQAQWQKGLQLAGLGAVGIGLTSLMFTLLARIHPFESLLVSTAVGFWIGVVSWVVHLIRRPASTAPAVFGTPGHWLGVNVNIALLLIVPIVLLFLAKMRVESQVATERQRQEIQRSQQNVQHHQRMTQRRVEEAALATPMDNIEQVDQLGPLILDFGDGFVNVPESAMGYRSSPRQVSVKLVPRQENGSLSPEEAAMGGSMPSPMEMGMGGMGMASMGSGDVVMLREGDSTRRAYPQKTSGLYWLAPGDYDVYLYDWEYGWILPKDVAEMSAHTPYAPRRGGSKRYHSTITVTPLQMASVIVRSSDPLALMQSIAENSPDLTGAPHFQRFQWNTVTYILSGEQARVIQRLLDVEINGEASAAELDLLQAARLQVPGNPNAAAGGETSPPDLERHSLKALFNDGAHPAWGTLIQSLPDRRFHLSRPTRLPSPKPTDPPLESPATPQPESPSDQTEGADALLPLNERQGN